MVRDPQKMSPDQEVEAAKAKLKDAFRRVGEELGQTADDLQRRLSQTTAEVQDRVVGTVGQLQDKVQGTVDHLQGQVTGTVDHVHQRLQGTVEGLGVSLKDTVDHLQKTVAETTHQLNEQMNAVVSNSAEAIRRRPLESLAVAAVAGVAVGVLTGRGRDHRVSSPPTHRPASPSPTHPGGPEEHRIGQAPGLLTDIALGGVGKMVWDVVQREYLTPQNIKGWIDALLTKPKEPR